MANCIYSDWHGKCTMYDPDQSNTELGCSDNGDCWCQEDPDPSMSCVYFEDPDFDEEEGW